MPCEIGYMDDYAGATGRITLAALSRLAPDAWAVQPKIDGMYVRVYLDMAGRVARVYSRGGHEVPAPLWAGLRGQYVGWPCAELVGELEASTERGNRHAAIRGYRAVHAFDLLHDGRRSLRDRPYRDRRDALWRMQAEIECMGPSAPWYRDPDGRLREHGTHRFASDTGHGWRTIPIVEQASPRHVDSLWARVDSGELEGVVAVRLDAAIGARAAKRKCKPVDESRGVVVRVDSRCAEVVIDGGAKCIVRRRSVSVGDRVVVLHEGYHEATPTASATRCGEGAGALPSPRFARLRA